LTPFSQDLAGLLEQPAPACLRCGSCCQAGGPALHGDDLGLLAGGRLARADLVTLRAGELARDNVAGSFAPLGREIVKLAHRAPGHACIFHDAASSLCAIHAHRPAECRLLSCRAPQALRSYYEQGRLTRADIINQESALAELVRFHDASFPAAGAMRLARQAAAGSAQALETLAALSRAELRFRAAFLDKTKAGPGELDFLFGRSLARICAPFGLDLPGRAASPSEGAMDTDVRLP